MESSCFCGAPADPKIMSDIPMCKSCKESQLSMLKEFNKNKKYNDPQIDKIIEGLYLGNEDASRDKNMLKQNGITHILVCGSQLEQNFPDDFKYKVLEIDDAIKQSIKEHFASCYEFINEARNSGGHVFLHCASGVSRSASIVISYLMKLNNWKNNEAYSFVKNIRKCICPNSGFQKQLEEYHPEISNQTCS